MSAAHWPLLEEELLQIGRLLGDLQAASRAQTSVYVERNYVVALQRHCGMADRLAAVVLDELSLLPSEPEVRQRSAGPVIG